MKHSTKKRRRALSLLLCLVFAWTLAPVQAFAAGTYDPTDVAAVNKIIGIESRQPQPDRHIGFWRRWFGGADHIALG